MNKQKIDADDEKLKKNPSVAFRFLCVCLSNMQFVFFLTLSREEKNN